MDESTMRYVKGRNRIESGFWGGDFAGIGGTEIHIDSAKIRTTRGQKQLS